MQFKVVMMYDESYKIIGDITSKAVTSYCELHRYALACYKSCLRQDLHPSWNKLLALQRELDDADWLFWLDADALLIDKMLPLEQLVAGLEQDKFMGVSSDYNGICAGVFLIKNCQWSKDLLATMLFLGDLDLHRTNRFDTRTRWDQNTLKCLADYFPTVRDRIAQIPESLISNPRSPFSPDAFVMHYWASGGQLEEISRKMNEILTNGSRMS
jgi:hypothetical protein